MNSTHTNFILDSRKDTQLFQHYSKIASILESKLKDSDICLSINDDGYPKITVKFNRTVNAIENKWLALNNFILNREYYTLEGK